MFAAPVPSQRSWCLIWRTAHCGLNFKSKERRSGFTVSLEAWTAHLLLQAVTQGKSVSIAVKQNSSREEGIFIDRVASWATAIAAKERLDQLTWQASMSRTAGRSFKIIVPAIDSGNQVACLWPATAPGARQDPDWLVVDTHTAEHWTLGIGSLAGCRVVGGNFLQSRFPEQGTRLPPLLPAVMHTVSPKQLTESLPLPVVLVRLVREYTDHTCAWCDVLSTPAPVPRA